MVETTCHSCGRAFLVKPYRLARNRSGKIFCSVECRRADGSTLGRPRSTTSLLTCPVCGNRFHRKPSERRATNYCSYSCAAVGTGNLRPTPKGARRSPATEFGARPPHNRLPVGSVTIRRRPGRGDDRRAWVKVAEPNVWRPRAVVVWELAHGPLPSGKVVHHKNRDTLDDAIDNLEAVDRATHLHEHRPEFEAKRASRARASRPRRR